MKKRNLFLMVLFSILTFGIYSLYWYCSFQNQLKKCTHEGFGGFGHLMATIFTFGIYGFVWSYLAGKRINKLGGVDMSFVYLLLTFFALGFVGYLLMQNQVNNLETGSKAINS